MAASRRIPPLPRKFNAIQSTFVLIGIDLLSNFAKTLPHGHLSTL